MCCFIVERYGISFVENIDICGSERKNHLRYLLRINEDIKLLVGILDLNEFVVLVEKAYKAKELSKEKKKVDSEARDERKRSMSKSYHSSSKRFKDATNRSNVLFGHSSKDCVKQNTGSKTQTPMESSVGSVRSNKPESRQCGRRHIGECWGKYNNRACYKCGSQYHFIRDFLELAEKDNMQSARPSNTTSRGRPPRNTGNREHLPEPTLFALEKKRHLQTKTLPVESTEFVIRVSNPLGKCVLVDKVCKNCPLMFRDICFSANLILLPFDEFDIILGMDWLTLHNAIVNCKRKSIDLRSQNSEIVRIESSDLNGLPAIISSMKALNYVKKGCEAYLAYVIDTKVTEKKVESVLVVCEFPDVFPE
ncbi:Gag-Pol polyprotein [Gossypium australe]|uniref:Gag-Pol polyprotein n=1 Tax=Gossypium australe TaxID=47621 RepID=A0A5B6UX09_9ROSI|nr:Gag-Pol polyprotein [Gossypium australe]